jgi:nitric oxide dioxygenase
MAFALINQERGLYSARGVRPETVWREWEVAEKIQETEDVVTFRMRRTDDRLVRTSLPGQYVTVQVPMPDGVRQPRQYSLISADDGVHREFAVKRVREVDGKPAGEVSNHLCDSVGVGDRLTISLPFGDVVLDDSGRPVVFASAGIGVAPMAGMLSHLAAAGSHLPITLLHADLDEASFALRHKVVDHVRAMAGASVHVWYERGAHSTLPVDVHAGVLDLDDVKLPADAVYYLCGPLRFMQGVRSALIERDVPVRDIQYEVFGPDLWQADLVSEDSPGAGDSAAPTAG